MSSANASQISFRPDGNISFSAPANAAPGARLQMFDVSGVKEAEKKDLYKLSKNLNSKINFEGILSNDEVIKKLSKHKFYIHTALYEGNPKTILEAMSVGCVVIVPNNRNILEIVQDNYNGIIYDQKKDNLKNTIQNL